MQFEADTKPMVGLDIEAQTNKHSGSYSIDAEAIQTADSMMLQELG